MKVPPRLLGTAPWVLVALPALFALALSVAYAHEGRDVGKYRLEVGFVAEPAIEGQKNGVALEVTNIQTDKPVEGLEDSLQVEITHVSSGIAKAFKLTPVFRDPGHYAIGLVFTQPGQYRFRVFGGIEGTVVNEAFTSGTGALDNVEAPADLQFPEQVPTPREVASAVRGAESRTQKAQDIALDAKDMASSARTLAVLGIVLGIVGVLAGAGSMMVVLRRH